ncbi:MAG: amino acid adenylation domain-containing protein [Pseudomonadota bacterium]
MVLKTLTTEQEALFERALEGKGISVVAGEELSADGAQGAYAQLSSSQRRMWFIDQLTPGSGAYNVSQIFMLRGSLDRDALFESLASVVERHQVLRAFYPQHEGEPSMSVSGGEHHECCFHDLISARPSDREDQLRALLQREADRPFKLSCGPVFRANLVRTEEHVHFLQIVIHHIATDQTSLDIVDREISELYSARVSGRAPELPAVTHQYSDYARWEASSAMSGRLGESLAYWRRTLEDLPKKLPIGRASHAGGEGAQRQCDTVSQLIPLAVDDELTRIGVGENTTRFTIYLAALKALLSLATGERDVLIATPANNRTRESFEAIVGFFANTVVLRSKIDDGEDFITLARDVGRGVVAALAHQSLPFERVIQESATDHPSQRSGSLLQTMFVLVDSTERHLRLPGIEIEGIDHAQSDAKFDMVWQVDLKPYGVVVSLQFAIDVVDKLTAAKLLHQYTTLLKDLVTSPQLALSCHELTSGPTDRAEGTLATAHAHDSVAAVFRAAAAKFPRKAAVRTTSDTISYAELDKRSDHLAGVLSQKDQRIVGIVSAAGIDMIIAMLACLKANKIYVPIDATYPPERQRRIADNAKVGIVLFEQEATALTFMDSPEPIVSINTNELDPMETPFTGPITERNAYILYTSGTTGVPKGVLQSQENLLYFHRRYVEALSLTPDDEVLALSSFGCDASVMDIFAALLTGATLSVLDLKQHNLQQQLEFVAAHAVTIYHSTPSVFKYLFSNDAVERIPELAGNLRAVVMGGELVDSAVLSLAKRRLSENCVFINGYGPSESTLAMQCISKVAELDPQGAANIGRPVPGTEVSLRDDTGTEVGVGDVGEIVIQSPYVALGYWGDEEQTSLRFSEQSDGARSYRTGDYGRRRPDGSIDFVGRTDRQVKIRGHRVELLEVEAHLSEHAAVRSVAVVPRKSAGHTQLVAYYVWDYANVVVDAECLSLLPDDDAGPAGTAAPVKAALEASVGALLAAFLSERVPSYMVPTALVRVEKMPLNHHGKLDVDALPSPIGKVSTGTGQGPATGTQRRLSGLWSRRLGRSDIGADEDFFELGGDSLLAMSLVGDVCELFSVDINISEFFDASTVAALASVVENAKTRSVLEGPIDAPRSGAKGAVALSNEQRQLWLTEQLEGSSLHYHLPLLYELEGTVDVGRLEQVLRDTVERHQALRTVIVQQPDGTAVGKLLSADEFVLSHRSLAQVTEREIADALNEPKQSPFDLSCDFMLRATLVSCDGRPRYLLIVLHHIAADSWSLNLLHEHLMREMTCASDAKAAAVRPISQYRDYARWQEGRLTESQRRRQLNYWEDQLSNSPPVHNLRLAVPRGAQPDYTAAYVRRAVSAERSKRLKEFASSQGMTLSMMIQAAFSLALSRYSQTDDIVMGSPVANRPRRHFEDLIGFFVNTVALRVDCHHGQRVGDFLDAVRRANLGALAHQDVSFEEVVERLNPGRSNQYTPLFQIMLGMDVPASATSLQQRSSLKRKRCATGHAKYELSLFVTDDADGLCFEYEYRAQLFESRTIEMMARHVENLLLRLMTADSSQPLGELKMLSREDESYLLNDMNRPPMLLGEVPETVHALIQAQVSRSPEATAFIFGEWRCTYREFENWANAIANRLVAEGLGPHARIGVCLPSSPAVFATMYAVMKVGATFVPIDHTYPIDRVRSIIEDSDIEGAITHASMHAVFEKVPTVALLTDLELTAYPAADVDFHGPAEARDSVAPVYIIYTSGSTGKPKGVQISHAGAVNFLCGFVQALGISTRKTWLQLASVSFDITLVEWGACLATGGCCVIADDDVRMDAEGQLKLIANQRIEVMQATPSRWRQLFATGWTIRHEVVGVSVGEALGEDLVQLFREKPLTIWNCYGPTETTVYATVKNVCDPATVGEPVSIGRALPGYTHYVCDKQGQLVPYGVIGELYLGGVGVGDGYFNRESLNKERFVPHPWSEDPGARLYRTGDQVCYRSDGELTYIGREDHQVKYRGYRIELGEIEFQLTQSSHVSAALVLLEDPQSAAPALRAFLQRAEGVHVAPCVIIDAAKQRLIHTLPAYMAPHDYCVLDELPLTPNGKIDRAALLSIRGENTSAVLAMPESPAERAVASIWEDLLGVSDVGLHDNFFNLGGQSLMAIKIVSRIERVFRLEISLREFFSDPSIQGNLDALSAHVGSRADLDEVAQLYELVAELSPGEVTALLESQTA